MLLRYTLLLGLFVSFIPSVLQAQKVRPLYVEAGISINDISLYRDFNYKLYDNRRQYSSAQTNNNYAAPAPGLHAGLHWEWKDRLHLKTTLAYAQGQTVDKPNLEFFSFSSSSAPQPELDVPLTSPRSFRFGVGELLFLYAPRHGYRWEWQFGAGISYAIWQQEYRQGFEYDTALKLYVVERTATETKSSLGLPLRLQLQYLLNQNFKLGLSSQTNLLFTGDSQAGLQIALLYRLH